MREIFSAVGLSFVLTLGSAHGQDLKSAQTCTRVGDDVSRLSCYDAVFGVAKSSSAQKASAGTKDVVANFGDNSSLHPDSSADLPKNISAHVQQVIPLAHGLYLLTLENGQVWHTTQEDLALQFKANDEVVLSRRVLGGYEISLVGRNASVNATRTK